MFFEKNVANEWGEMSRCVRAITSICVWIFMNGKVIDGGQLKVPASHHKLCMKSTNNGCRRTTFGAGELWLIAKVNLWAFIASVEFHRAEWLTRYLGSINPSHAVEPLIGQNISARKHSLRLSISRKWFDFLLWILGTKTKARLIRYNALT